MPGPTPSQPGWYPDGDGNERWYDGNDWTEHVRGEAPGDSTVVVPSSGPGTTELPQAGAAPGAPGQPGAPASLSQLEVGGGRGLRIALAVLGALLLIGVVVFGAFLLLDGGDEDKATDDPTPTVSDSGTATDAPAESSLDVPTIDPSDFPTDLPTEVPSDLPTIPDVPTRLPSGIPSNFPSEFPTNPSDLDSWFSDYLEQVKP